MSLNSTDNVALLILDVEVPPNTGSHIIFPGNYKVKIKFAANNLKSVEEKVYNVVINDKWTDDEKQMLDNNVSIKEI